MGTYVFLSGPLPWDGSGALARQVFLSPEASPPVSVI